MFSLRSDLSSRRLCAEKYVTVMSTVPGCDVTTVQLHNTGSTSKLCKVQHCGVCSLRNFPNSFLQRTAVLLPQITRVLSSVHSAVEAPHVRFGSPGVFTSVGHSTNTSRCACGMKCAGESRCATTSTFRSHETFLDTFNDS